MSINFIIDKTCYMTKRSYEMFVEHGCIPHCHCCNKAIKINEKYRLATVSEKLVLDAAMSIDDRRYRPFKEHIEHQVMLCGDIFCTPEKMLKDAVENWAKLKRYQNYAYSSYLSPAPRSGGCFIVNGEIVL